MPNAFGSVLSCPLVLHDCALLANLDRKEASLIIAKVGRLVCLAGRLRVEAGLSELGTPLSAVARVDYEAPVADKNGR